ncbi:peptidase s41 family protein [Gigaspora margarita]|uniref:Peptidase s41 family protein n=1 Tax=Gigaspora margarita TaxID=4874 RepID=A0A8H4A7A3_GIGMA|nr:peptidase s41 family protein [Gigaspora margarita]
MRIFLIILPILLLLATQGGQSALPTLSPISTKFFNLETNDTENSLSKLTNLKTDDTESKITNLGINGADSVDGCANIHKKFNAANTAGKDLSFSFSDVSSCYNSFKFDNNIRTATIDTIKKILNGFYVFNDQAKQPPESGFTFDPVDISKELDSIAKKQYNNDFEFTTDVINLIIKMKDAHTFYFPICYTRFTFTQQLALYAIVANDGSQQIKVFKDTLDSSNKNCVVDEIDGHPALDVIKQYARDTVFISKDLGVRFNMALASLALVNGNLQLHPRSSQFNIRLVLPDKDSITYTLNCGSGTKTVVREWVAFINNGDDLNNFSDSASYWSKFCVNPSAPTPSQSPTSTQLPISTQLPTSTQSSTSIQSPTSTQPPAFTKPPKSTKLTKPVSSQTQLSPRPKRSQTSKPKSSQHPKSFTNPISKFRNSNRRQTYHKSFMKPFSKFENSKLRQTHRFRNSFDPVQMNDANLFKEDVVLSDATLVFDAKFAQFYKLKSKNNIGVAMISTEDVPISINDAFISLVNGFKALANNSATKLILDLSNNEGGFTVISHFINRLLFPDTYPAFPTDFSLTDIKKAAIEAVDIKKPPFSLFDRSIYLTSPDALPFNSTDEFLKVKGFGFENDKDEINNFINQNSISLPWNSSNMVILTNGYCGSACSSIALHLSEINNVTTVSVGGFQKTPLSISSFIGGQEFFFTDPNNGFEDLVKELNRLGLSNNDQAPQQFPTNIFFPFVIRRAFSIKNPNQVLEFTFKPAQNQINYNDQSVRDFSIIWDQAATFLPA